MQKNVGLILLVVEAAQIVRWHTALELPMWTQLNLIFISKGFSTKNAHHLPILISTSRGITVMIFTVIFSIPTVTITCVCLEHMSRIRDVQYSVNWEKFLVYRKKRLMNSSKIGKRKQTVITFGSLYIPTPV